MASTNFEEIIKIIALLSAIYLFLQFFIPMIQNLIAQGLVGFTLVIMMVWWLAQKN
ncbi:MAG: hypothetical protein U9Q06_01360 [Nanoarchaeota archaeon]|nr:hypothetical protein [Nanoarchaeota archaeon]